MQQSLYTPTQPAAAQAIQWTQILTAKTNVEFAKTNVGDVFLTGFGEGYIIEALMSDGQAYAATFDEMGYFYIELPWVLSSEEQFQINIYDANKVLIETIPVTMQVSVADTRAPNVPTLEQKLVEGQVVVSGFGEPNTLVLVRSTTKSPVIIPTDTTGYFFLELSKPMEIDEVVSVFSVDLADNVSDQEIVEQIVENSTRPAMPIIEPGEFEEMQVKGQATPKTLVVLKRISQEKVNFLQTETDEQGKFSINLTIPLLPGDKLVFYAADLLSYNNIILSEPVQIEIE